ncbi:MAG: 50S ribosomal protein L15 [Longimicrobiales bacterium]|nr:50S ribosomal protein L15 [Longimicrobiales bacterium]
MAELHDLSPVGGSRRDRKRVGRGPGSGTGKTSGRGEKGQKARSGGSVRPGFEGGQMPLHRRIPKRGFHNRNRVEYQVVNVGHLAGIEGPVTPEALRAAGLIRSLRLPVKVLGDGDVSSPFAVTAHAFSQTARTKIEAAGGTVTVLGRDQDDDQA